MSSSSLSSSSTPSPTRPLFFLKTFLYLKKLETNVDSLSESQIRQKVITSQEEFDEFLTSLMDNRWNVRNAELMEEVKRETKKRRTAEFLHYRSMELMKEEERLHNCTKARLSRVFSKIETLEGEIDQLKKSRKRPHEETPNVGDIGKMFDLSRRKSQRGNDYNPFQT